MKRLVLTLLGLMIVSLGIGLIISPADLRGFSISSASHTVDVRKSQSLSGIATVSLETTSHDIHVSRGSGDALEAHLFGTVGGSNTDDPLSLQQDGDILHISESKQPHLGFAIFGIGTRSAVLEVTLPKSYTGNLEVSTVSGDLTLTGPGTPLTATSVSGDLSLTLDSLVGPMKTTTVSGDVQLNLPADSSFSTDFSTVSGDVRNDFTGDSSISHGRYHASVGGGSQNITINTTSGDLRISKR